MCLDEFLLMSDDIEWPLLRNDLIW